jgi:hypothetical protein
VSITCTLRAVEAETSSRRPSGEIAMWSERYPSIFTRQTIRPSRRLIATTSARLGRETKTRRPFLEVKASSTYWSWPSPTSWRMPRK